MDVGDLGTVITGVIILAIVSLAAWYVIRSKKKGKKCIGCPEGCCSSKKGGCPCCGGKEDTGKENG